MPNPSKANLQKRVFALVIDNLIGVALSFAPVLGPLLAIGYILFRDGFNWKFMPQRSFGKKIMKLEVTLPKGQLGSLPILASMKRNSLLALPAVISYMPVIGWMVAYPIAILVYWVEGTKVILNVRGLRFGDHWAHTQVIESPMKTEVFREMEPMNRKQMWRLQGDKRKNRRTLCSSCWPAPLGGNRGTQIF